MKVREYLPSAQFALILGSIAASAGLVFAADYFIDNSGSSGDSETLVVETQNTAANWRQMLAEIQSQNNTYSAPEPPSEHAVENLIAAAQTSNLTDTIGRTLLINLSSAKAQGLGSDIPTQESLIGGAVEQITKNRGAALYSTKDLTLVPSSADVLHTYGNDVIGAIRRHPKADYRQTLLLMAQAIDHGDTSKIKELAAVGSAYKDLTRDLASIPVPQTLSPLHLQAVNNLARIGELYTDMGAVLEDPLRGLAGLQLYESLIEETTRVFTNIAQQLMRNGILFEKDEPGSAWSSFIPS